MSDLDEANVLLIAKLRREGLTNEAIHRVTGFDVRTIRKYVDVQIPDVTLPHCQCKPGLYIIGCEYCEGKHELDEEAEVVSK